MPETRSSDPVPEHIWPGLLILWQAYAYAEELDRSVWDFAVSIQSLRDAGLTEADLRSLVCRSYVEHGREITATGDDQREFRPTGKLVFKKRTCFVLSEAGVRLVSERRRIGLAAETYSNAPPHAGNGHSDEHPHWDADRSELRVDGVLVKEFKLPSPNQQTILAAFEEEGWPPRIDDPLPPAPELVPKRRLHDTIRGLNRNQKCHLIQFMGDGTGTGVRWELLRRISECPQVDR